MNVSQVIQEGEAVVTEVATLSLTLIIDQQELAAGSLVKAGQVGSVGGKPVYVYLSENPNAV